MGSVICLISASNAISPNTQAIGLRIVAQCDILLKVRPMFDQRVLPVFKDILFNWRLLVEEGRKAAIGKVQE